MKRILAAAFLLLCSLTLTAEIKPGTPLFRGGKGGKVYYVPQFTEFKEISGADLLFLKKVLARAEKKQIKAVIFELDTPGGGVDVALRYLSVMARSRVPVVAYLNPQGISAGMIIALGADRIAIHPKGVIGDAMPLQISNGAVRPLTDRREKPAAAKPGSAAAAEKKAPGPGLDELIRLVKELQKQGKPSGKADEKADRELADQKFLTVFFKILQVCAENGGRPVKVIRAAADPYVSLSLKEDGIEHRSGSPLTLSAQEAKRLGVADYIASDRQELLAAMGLPEAELEIVRKDAVEEIVSFLAYPAVAGLLLMFGLIGLFVEIKTPGFGVSGVLGVACLVLFFLGHVASGASEWGPMVIFFVGLLLLLLEIFVIPGFGLVGVLGVFCVLCSFFGAFGWENLDLAVRVVGGSLFGAVVIMILLAVYVLPKTPLFRHLVLDSSTGREAGSAKDAAPQEDLCGAAGKALTPLRPCGTVEIAGRRYDAAAEGEYIAAGSDVKVIACRGFGITVAPVLREEKRAD